MVTHATPSASIETLDIERSVHIAAPPTTTWDSVLLEFGPGTGGPGPDMPLVLEAFPGGRWFRDLGEAGGHLWGHVQVIKPPRVLELVGPMFMSYPVASHVQVRLTEEDGGTRLDLRHRAIGLIDPEHASGMREGWGMMAEAIAAHASGG